MRISNIEIGNGIRINQVIQKIATYTTHAFWNLSRFSYNDKNYVVVLPCIYIHFQLYHIVILKTYNCRQDDQNTVYMQVVFHINLIFCLYNVFWFVHPNLNRLKVGPTWSPCSAVVGKINVVQIIPSKSSKLWDIFTLQMILWKQYSYIAVIHVEIYRYAVFSSIFAVHQFFNFCRC